MSPATDHPLLRWGSTFWSQVTRMKQVSRNKDFSTMPRHCHSISDFGWSVRQCAACQAARKCNFLRFLTTAEWHASIEHLSANLLRGASALQVQAPKRMEQNLSHRQINMMRSGGKGSLPRCVPTPAYRSPTRPWIITCGGRGAWHLASNPSADTRRVPSPGKPCMSNCTWSPAADGSELIWALLDSTLQVLQVQGGRPEPHINSRRVPSAHLASMDRSQWRPGKLAAVLSHTALARATVLLEDELEQASHPVWTAQQ